jgi:hypothetical protein
MLGTSSNQISDPESIDCPATKGRSGGLSMPMTMDTIDDEWKR